LLLFGVGTQHHAPKTNKQKHMHQTKTNKKGRVVSGHYDALDRVAAAALAAGALKAARLPVSGAFHTSLMAPARARLEAALAAATVAPPRVPVLSNVTGLPFPGDAESIRALLARQLVEPVQWQATLEALTAAVPAASAAGSASAGGGGAGGGEAGAAPGRRALFELGPGAQIKSMVRRIDGAAWKALVNVSAE
jgi:[acyl-carrier-protein] S-malonyltransferase